MAFRTGRTAVVYLEPPCRSLLKSRSRRGPASAEGLSLNSGSNVWDHEEPHECGAFSSSILLLHKIHVTLTLQVSKFAERNGALVELQPIPNLYPWPPAIILKGFIYLCRELAQCNSDGNAHSSVVKDQPEVI